MTKGKNEMNQVYEISVSFSLYPDNILWRVQGPNLPSVRFVAGRTIQRKIEAGGRCDPETEGQLQTLRNIKFCEGVMTVGKYRVEMRQVLIETVL